VSAKVALVRKALTNLVNDKRILRIGAGAKGLLFSNFFLKQFDFRY